MSKDYEAIRARRPSAWFLAPALVSLVLFGMAHKDWLWVVICAVGLLRSYFVETTLQWPTRKRWFRVVLWLLAGLGVAQLYFLTVLDGGAQLAYFPRFVLGPWFFGPTGLLAVLLLVWLWYTSFLERERGWAIYGLTGWIVICSGQMMHPSALFVAVLLFYCLVILLTLFVAGIGRQAHQTTWELERRQLALFSVWVCLVGGSTWGVLKGLQQLDRNMSRLLGELLHVPSYSGHLGANGSMRLARWQHVRLSPKLVASIRAKRHPGYLRTRVLSRYHRGLWSMDFRRQRKVLPRRDGRFQWFSLGASPGQRVPEPRDSDVNVRAFVTLGGPVLLGYGAAWLRTERDVRCQKTQTHMLSCAPIQKMSLYRYAAQKGGVPWGIGMATLRRPLPSRMSWRLQRSSLRHALHVRREKQLQAVYRALKPLARQIAGKHVKEPLATAQRLQRYFRANYRYSLRVKLASKGDPTVDFVLHKRPAFCQYFASGLALMMRSLGHRARVVTGFLAKEYNAYTQTWLLRQRDAHAWTEVYDPVTRRWVGFDATAPTMHAALQPTRKASSWQEFRTWMGVRWRRFMSFLRDGQFGRWLSFRLVDGLRGLVSLRGVLWLAWLVLVVWLWRKRHRLWRALLAWWKRERHRDAPTIEESGASLVQRQVRVLVCRVLAVGEQAGVPIASGETLEQYTLRCERLSKEGDGVVLPSRDDWEAFLQQYNALRFSVPCSSGQVAVEEAMASFEKQVEHMCRMWERAIMAQHNTE